ncbi:MAG: hypothetical protein IJ400_02635 [Clostridia bacterium]|nr:hypothetical protein [Clostridia bacterium]
MSKRYRIYDGYSWRDYEVEDVGFISDSVWDDSVGACFVEPVNKGIDCFNELYKTTWEKIEQLLERLEIDENKIKYESMGDKINELRH